MNVKYFGLICGAFLAAPSLSTAAPVDLSSWSVEGSNSSWNVAADNNSVLQTVNGSPTVFHNGVNSQGNALERHHRS